MMHWTSYTKIDSEGDIQYAGYLEWAVVGSTYVIRGTDHRIILEHNMPRASLQTRIMEMYTDGV